MTNAAQAGSDVVTTILILLIVLAWWKLSCWVAKKIVEIEDAEIRQAKAERTARLQERYREIVTEHVKREQAKQLEAILSQMMDDEAAKPFALDPPTDDEYRAEADGRRVA